MGLKTKVVVAMVLGGAAVARALPERVFEAFSGATGQNIRIASGAAVDGAYGVVVGSTVDAADATQLFAVCEKCDDPTSTYVFTVDATGNVTYSGDMVLENGERIRNSTDDTVTLVRDDAGAVVFNCADTDAVCNLTVSAGSTGALTLGVVANTSITLTTDGTGTGEVVLPNGAIGQLELDADIVDGAQLADTINLDADLAFTLGAAEQFIWNKTATDATGDYGAVFNYTASDTTTSTTGQHALSITNAASTEAADSLLELDNADADDNVGKAILIANPARFTSHFDMTGAAVFGSASVTGWTFTSDGALDADFVVPNTSIGASEIVLDAINGAQLADTITFDATLLGIANGSTGAVTLNWHDYADATDDDMAHVVMTADCTDTGTGAEDCDFSIGVVEAGAAAETRFLIDADGGITVGSANTNSVTLTTSATGDAALVLPTGGVATGEILDGTLLPADDAYPAHGSFTVCGDLVTLSGATPVYYASSMALVESATVGLARTCNTAAAGNVTEATADEPAFTATAFLVTGLDCIVQDVNVTSVTFAARSAGAALTPAVSCAALDGQLGCTSNTASTTAVASGATFAIQATAADGDVGDVQFICTVNIRY